MHNQVLKSIGRIIALGLLASMPMAMTAQSTKAATKAAMVNNPDSPPKWDIFAGYSALIPNGDICCYRAAGQFFGYNAIDYGAILSWSAGKGPNLGEPVVTVVRAFDVPKLEDLYCNLLNR